MTYKKKSYKKFVATAATATLVASAIVPAVSAASFPDVEEKHEFATYIDAAVEAGYIKGYADGTFGINDNLKRSQVVIIIGRYLESLGYDSEATTSPWSDVTDKEVIKYGNIVKDAGVFTGYADGTLNGNAFITRENMAVVLDRLAETVTGISLSAVAEEIEDVEIADLATANADYQASIQALRDLEISTAENFNPKGNVKRGQFAKFIINAVETIDAIAEATPELEVESVTAIDEKTIEVTFADGTVVEFELAEPLVEGENEVTFEHEGTEYTVTVEYTAATEVAIESVKAVNAKELQVTFNKAVEDTTKAVFEAKRGTTTVNGLEVSWNADKTIATLTSGVNLTAGDYTVTVNGLSEEALVGEVVKVEAQKVSKVEITSKQLIKNNAVPVATAGTFTYKVVDQYGTDITKTTPQSAFNLNAVVGASNATVTLNPATGVATVNHMFSTTDSKAVVTLVHAATGVATTATLDVAAAVTVENVTFGENILPTGKTRIEAGLSEAVRVPLTVLDQYGSEIKDVATLGSSLQLISSNNNVTFKYETDEKNNVFLVADTSALASKATVVLTAVNPTSGKTFSKTFDIVAASAPYSIELGELSASTIAAGDKGIALPITVKDQFGEQLTAEQIVKHASKIESWVTGDSNAQISNLTIDTDKTSKTYGQFVFNATTKGTVSLVVNTGNAVQTKLFEVKDARVVSSVSKVENVTLLQGATTDLKFVFKDQYGAEIKNDNVVDNSALSYKVELTKVSGDNGAVTTTELQTGADEDEIAEISVKAASDKTGSYKVTVTLVDAYNVAVSSASTTVTVKENNVAGLTYELANVPTLNGSADNTAALDATNVYAQELKLTAKDANGQTYVINPDDILSVKSSNENVAKVAKAADNKIYVAGKNVTSISTPAKEEKATITVTLNTLDGLKTVTKEVTVSPKAAVVEEIKVVTVALGAATQKLPTTVVEKSLFEVANKTDAVAGIEFYAIGKDQYGVWNNIEPTVIVNSTNVAELGSITYNTSTDKLEVADKTKIAGGKDILLTLTSGKATKTITYKVLEADKLTLAGAPTPDATFTATTNFGYTLDVSNIDMNPTVAGIQNSVEIDGITYTVTTVAGTATVAATGTPTAPTPAKSSVIKVTFDNGKTVASDTINLKITANDGTSFTIAK